MSLERSFQSINKWPKKRETFCPVYCVPSVSLMGSDQEIYIIHFDNLFFSLFLSKNDDTKINAHWERLIHSALYDCSINLVQLDLSTFMFEYLWKDWDISKENSKSLTVSHINLHRFLVKNVSEKDKKKSFLLNMTRYTSETLNGIYIR